MTSSCKLLQSEYFKNTFFVVKYIFYHTSLSCKDKFASSFFFSTYRQVEKAPALAMYVIKIKYDDTLRRIVMDDAPEPFTFECL
jgi:hypothetical protein